VATLRNAITQRQDKFMDGTFSLDDEIQEMVHDIEVGTAELRDTDPRTPVAVAQQSRPFEFVSFDSTDSAQQAASGQRTVQIEIGGRTLSANELDQLNSDSVIELDEAAGESVNVLVDGSLYAKGELLVVNEKLAIRISELC
jgi:flagellar motor switch protein FliN